MKKLFICFTLATLTACASSPIPGPISQSPAQVAAQVCPPIQTALFGLQALAGLPPGAQADLAAVAPVVNGVCAAGAVVDATSLQTLMKTAMPALLAVVKASALPVDEQDRIVLDITAAQIILTAASQVQAGAK